MKRKGETYLQTLKVKCFLSWSPHFCLLGGLVGLTHLLIYLFIYFVYFQNRHFKLHEHERVQYYSSGK